jgi:ParB/RepB/Spo0J family partition protein
MPKPATAGPRAARRSGPATHSKQHTKTEVSPPSRSPLATPVPTGEPEYTLVSVSMIDPAPWGSRLVIADIEELTASIRGDGSVQGVGVVEPILVRRAPSGRYQLIDGERRLRAGQLIAAEREGDYLLPARVYQVSDSVAQLIADAANNERDQHKPLERALAYQRLRDTLAQESPGVRIGVRRVAEIGWHGHTQVADYLTIADRLTADVLRAVGIMDASGAVDGQLVTRLSTAELLAAARAETTEGRIATLKGRVDRIRDGAVGKSRTSTSDAGSLEQQGHPREPAGLGLRLRRPVETLAPDVARQVVTRELAPTIVAVVDRAHSQRGGAGYHAEFAREHTMLVIPREVQRL